MGMLYFSSMTAEDGGTHRPYVMSQMPLFGHNLPTRCTLTIRYGQGYVNGPARQGFLPRAGHTHVHAHIC